jgi:hypothetical protein
MSIEKIIARDHKLSEDYLKEAKLNTWQKINFHIRSWTNNKFGVWDIWDIVPYGWQRFYYDKIKTIFKPHHSRLRKAIPRQWWDLSGLIVEINFEIIKSFYEDETQRELLIGTLMNTTKNLLNGWKHLTNTSLWNAQNSKNKKMLHIQKQIIFLIGLEKKKLIKMALLLAL